MKGNYFKLAGRYKQLCEFDENHTCILIDSMPILKEEKEIIKNFFIEIDIYDKELISLVKNLKENDPILIEGHIETEFQKLDVDFTFINKILVAEKIMTKGN